MKARDLNFIAWGLSGGAVFLAILAWGQGNSWELVGISSYQLFPLFGLLAFSLMWGHYVVAALRIYYKIDKKHLKAYFEITSLAVLAAILLHPGLLAWQLWRDGLGLPPASEINFVGSDMKGAVIIGLISLVIFLAYELRRKFDQKPWWKYVQYSSDGAILLIVLHSLRLGSHLRLGWYLGIWYLYAISLVVALAYIYLDKIDAPKVDA